MFKIKPCPFCGEKDLIDYGIMRGTMQGFDYVQCENCGAEIHSIHNGKHIEAIEKWNTRTELLKEYPAVDAVEVVRCKDCKFLFDIGLCFENIKGIGYKKPNPNDFCSYGERKEGDESVSKS